MRSLSSPPIPVGSTRLATVPLKPLDYGGLSADLLGHSLGFATWTDGHLVGEPNQSTARDLTTVVDGTNEREDSRDAGIFYLSDALQDRGAALGLDLLRDPVQ
jgi:hypothetical protein